MARIISFVLVPVFVCLVATSLLLLGTLANPAEKPHHQSEHRMVERDAPAGSDSQDYYNEEEAAIKKSKSRVERAAAKPTTKKGAVVTTPKPAVTHPPAATTKKPTPNGASALSKLTILGTGPSPIK